MYPKIQIILSKARTKTGVLAVVLEDGKSEHFTCLGKSDNAAAKAHGNPERNPLDPFGDLPTGEYLGIVTVAGADLKSYGPNKRLLLQPFSGDALKSTAAPSPRWGLMLHGGAPATNGGLRPTHGCCRVSDDSMKRILELIGDSTAQVEVKEV